MFKSWFKKHKALLITFGISSVMFAILTSIQLNFLMGNLEDLYYYAETGEITESMYTYGIIAFVNLIVGLVWIALVLILMWRIIFPDYKTVKNAFFLTELEFIFNMPKSVRKELGKKNEQQ